MLIGAGCVSIQVPLDQELPDYTITRFTDSFYKIVKFHRNRFGFGFFGDCESHDTKLDASLSRARRNVLSLALCNTWDYFFTGTLSPDKWDRYDLVPFQRSLSQFFRDKRKKYSSPLSFLFVPEMHQDGAWHVHGLVSGIPPEFLTDFVPSIHPGYLCNKGYLNWPDYFNKFGFCSLGPVRNHVACAFYITKYITDDLSSRKSALGRHLYFCSQGLNREVVVSEVYGERAALDSCLDHHYQFCSTGYVDGWSWSDPLSFSDDFLPLEDVSDSVLESELDSMFLDFEQITLGGFYG